MSDVACLHDAIGYCILRSSLLWDVQCLMPAPSMTWPRQIAGGASSLSAGGIFDIATKFVEACPTSIVR